MLLYKQFPPLSFGSTYMYKSLLTSFAVVVSLSLTGCGKEPTLDETMNVTKSTLQVSSNWLDGEEMETVSEPEKFGDTGLSLVFVKNKTGSDVHPAIAHGQIEAGTKVCLTNVVYSSGARAGADRFLIAKAC